MSHHFAKPENALKRAEELLHVGQQNAALDSLHDVLSSKRHRTWTPVIEQVIIKYLDICISLKKGRMAKDGLIQYRNICQQVNIGSLEDVLRHLMNKVDAEARAAMANAEDVAATLVTDLDAEETPESILLSAMTGDDQATRTEREVVTPWLKFIWETYRTVLEILRSNQKLESLYSETAHKAFGFCVKYKRPTEMRRLCELLRNHLASLSKYPPREAVAAGTPTDGLAMHLEVRYAQLNAAADLELWQESYRTIEDIHALTLTLKKPPKTSMQLLCVAAPGRATLCGGRAPLPPPRCHARAL
jgi:translation initiation factor 3 subunit A